MARSFEHGTGSNGPSIQRRAGGRGCAYPEEREVLKILSGQGKTVHHKEVSARVRIMRWEEERHSLKKEVRVNSCIS